MVSFVKKSRKRKESSTKIKMNMKLVISETILLKLINFFCNSDAILRSLLLWVCQRKVPNSQTFRRYYLILFSESAYQVGRRVRGNKPFFPRVMHNSWRMPLPSNVQRRQKVKWEMRDESEEKKVNGRYCVRGEVGENFYEYLLFRLILHPASLHFPQLTEILIHFFQFWLTMFNLETDLSFTYYPQRI